MSDQSSVSEFRRWIVGISDTVLMLAVLLSTVGGGLAGYSWARIVTSISGISEGGAFRGTSAHPILLFGALCGAALGFIGSAAASGAAFALSEIAYHSRRMAEIFEKAREDSAGPLVMPGHVLEAGSSQASIRPTNRVHDSHPRAPTATGTPIVEKWITAVGEPLSQEAIAVINGAPEAGYRVSLERNNVIVFLSASGSKTFCHSNSDIVRAGGWTRTG